ncbi:MAG: DMT family transporter [Alphaproteobacteria bacterium]|nr:DMT family transporter [Alphaproteobacteria bacterium]MDE2112812.1 DMT family transporter [Alphaproteobacteria bacterium]MDE2492636.1 DMT family transporter [Alphaproteobacteria bacterium]
MKNVPLGIGLKLAQTLAFSLMYAAIKLAGPVPVGEIVFFRGFFAFLPLVVWTSLTVGPKVMFRTQRPLFHLSRSMFGVTSMFCNFTAVKLLALATVTAFSFMQPIFAVILAALFLREHVGRYRWGAVVIGFFGVLLMIEPHGGLTSLLELRLSAGVAYALAFSLLSATVIVIIRRMSATERSEAIVFYFMVSCSMAGALTLFWERVPLTFHQVFWLVFCGVIGGLGQMCMTFSYRYAEPSLLASFDYVSMIWATLLGYFVLAEMPETMVFVGAGVVITSGLLIAWRERRLHLARKLETVT